MATIYDWVIDASGANDADGTTLASGVGKGSVYVKNGTYAAGLTETNDDQSWEFEPGVVVQAAVTFSGDNIQVLFGSGCDVQGLLTMSGASICVECENGCDFDGVLMSGNNGYFNGGGWDSISDGGIASLAISITGNDAIVTNVACQTTAGGAGAFTALSISGLRGNAINIKVIDSDNHAIAITSTATYALLQGCIILGADVDGVLIEGPRTRVIACHVTACGGDGISVGTTGDNSLVVSSITSSITGTDILIDALGEDCCVVANRCVTGTITDNSGTSTVASNDVT